MGAAVIGLEAIEHVNETLAPDAPADCQRALEIPEDDARTYAKIVAPGWSPEAQKGCGVWIAV